MDDAVFAARLADIFARLVSGALTEATATAELTDLVIDAGGVLMPGDLAKRVQTYAKSQTKFPEWVTGPVDGGPEGDGRYPLTGPNGEEVLVPGLQKLVTQIAKGDPGEDAGRPYRFSTSTVDGNPGNGLLRLNHVDPAQATRLFIDHHDAKPAVLMEWLRTWREGGEVTIAQRAPLAVRVFRVTEPASVQGEYEAIGVVQISGALNAPFVNGAELIVTYVPPGLKGDTGVQGAQGPKGDTGNTGATGAQGPKGDTGAQGPAGPKGDIGNVGPVGPAGPKGDKGDTGAQGPIGPQGPAGSGTGDMLRSSNLSDVADSAAARTNIGADAAANVKFTPRAGAPAITRTVQDKLRDLPHLWDKLTTPDERAPTFDATAALTEIGALQDRFVLPRGDVFITGPVNWSADNGGLIGQGRGSRILAPAGANNLFRVGGGTADTHLSGVRFQNFRVWANAPRTGGFVFDCPYLTESEFVGVYLGHIDDYYGSNQQHRLWRGWNFNRFNEVEIFGGQAAVADEVVQMRGNADQSYGAEFVIGGKFRAFFSRLFARIGGGCGGVYFNRLDVSQCEDTVSIDETLAGVPNREIFFSEDSVFDDCRNTHVTIDQPTPKATMVHFAHTWLASAGQTLTGGAGKHGLHIKRAPEARIIADVHAFNNAGDGIRNDDPLAYVEVPSKAFLDTNGGVGYNQTVATERSRLGEARFLGNVARYSDHAKLARFRAGLPLILQGVWSGAGPLAIPHGIPSGQQRIGSVEGWLVDPGGTRSVLTEFQIDGANVYVHQSQSAWQASDGLTVKLVIRAAQAGGDLF